MIFIEHDGSKVKSAEGKDDAIVACIYTIAKNNPDKFLIIYKAGCDIERFLEQAISFKSKNHYVSSYNALNSDFGYVEDKPFIPTNNRVVYPTWKKGTTALLIHASLINQVANQIKPSDNYLYWINSLGKLTMPLGVLNYQIPIFNDVAPFSNELLYRFVKQHYKRRWTLHLLLCHLYYDKKLPLYAFAKAQFYKNRSISLDMESLQEVDSCKDYAPLKYDVIIPTIGREEYLKDVLEDLNKQRNPPSQVIIIEQNPSEDKESKLYYINDEKWNFTIIHKLLDTAGACRARNIAVSLATAPWLLFFDDDVRVESTFIDEVTSFINRTKATCITFACLQKGEKETMKAYKQWESFGSGCSIVHRDIYSKCSFDMAFENGYGEDVDYGMQVRNIGKDVIYAPSIQILHLKAPTGGFRSPHKFPWSTEALTPKPSPQIMYLRKKNYSLEQVRGYKWVLFFKFYRQNEIKNPIKYFKYFKAAWKSSEQWAKKISVDA